MRCLRNDFCLVMPTCKNSLIIILRLYKIFPSNHFVIGLSLCFSLTLVFILTGFHLLQKKRWSWWRRINMRDWPRKRSGGRGWQYCDPPFRLQVAPVSPLTFSFKTLTFSLNFSEMMKDNIILKQEANSLWTLSGGCIDLLACSL